MDVHGTENFERHARCIACGGSSLTAKKGYETQYLVACKSCGLVFPERVPTSAELEAFYATYSYSSDPWISPITLNRYYELLDAFENYRQTGKLFDTGCGAGHFLSVARERGWEVYGNEFSPAAVEICRSKGIAMVEGALSDPKTLPDGFEQLKGCFDIVTSFEVLEHVNTPIEDLRALHSLLRDGGLLYLTTPNFNSLARRWLRVNYNVLNYPEHLAHYTRRTLDATVKEAGFEKVKSWSDGISFSRIAGSRNPSAGIEIGSREAPDERMRKRIESRWYLMVLKRLANGLLRLSGTGSGLKGLYVKRQR